MTLMNNITGERRALQEEMLTVNKYYLFSSCSDESQGISIVLPFHLPQLVKSLPFYIPESRDRNPFRFGPPPIGHDREQFPSGVGGGGACFQISQGNNKHLMLAPRKTVSAPRGTMRVSGKQNSLFPEGPVIKCFVIPPDSKLENKNAKK